MSKYTPEQHAAMQLEQLMANSAPMTAAAIRSQLAAAISGGYDLSDTLHDIYRDFGYPAQLTFFQFWNMYRRFGIARRGVHVYADYTWQDEPLINGDAKVVRDVEYLVRRLRLWRRLKGLDVRQRVGRYGGMFMRVRDGKKPHEPLETKLTGVGALVAMVPLYESQLEVVSVGEDPTREDFDQPTMYRYSSSAVGTRNEKAGSSFNIHPSRVIPMAEGSDNGGIYGVSALEAPYNSLMDLRKILGAGGEGFYKNAAQNVVFELADAASATRNAKLLEEFNDQYDDFALNRQRRAIWTPGLTAKTLNSTLANPKEYAANSLLDVAAGFDTPLALLVGNQEGRLAGDQDTASFLQQVKSRRLNVATDIIEDTLAWLQKHGIVAAGSFEIEWPDITAPDDAARLANADAMAGINQKQYQSGQDAVYSAEEIREQSGYEAEVEGEIEDGADETLDDAEE